MSIENGETGLSVRTELNAAIAIASTALQPSAVGETVCAQDDARLSDARIPSSHGHAHTDISGLGTAATTASTDYATAAQGRLADTSLQTLLTMWEDHFRLGDVSGWTRQTIWGAGSIEMIDDGDGGYCARFICGENISVGVGTPGKTQLTKDFDAPLRVGDTIHVRQRFKFVSAISGDGSMFTNDTETRRIGSSPGIRLRFKDDGSIRVNRAKIGLPDIYPEFPVVVVTGQEHEIDWTWTVSDVGPSRLLLDGQVVHDGPYATKPPDDLLPAGFDFYYEYFQAGLTANSHTVAKEMIVYGADYSILDGVGKYASEKQGVKADSAVQPALWGDDFASGDFSDWSESPYLRGDTSTFTLNSDESGGYSVVAHADANLDEDLPGKSYIKREFFNPLVRDQSINLRLSFNLADMTGTGKLYTLDAICNKISGWTGIRLEISADGSIRVDRSSLGLGPIHPQFPVTISPGVDHAIDWTFTLSDVGPSRLLLDGQVVHDGPYATKPLDSLIPVGTTFLYDHFLVGLTNSHEVAKEMTIYEASYRILDAENSFIRIGDDVASLLGSGSATAGQVITADGAGGVAWESLSATGGHDAVTLAGTPDYITLAGQVLTRGLVDLATDVTGSLPVASITGLGNIATTSINAYAAASHTQAASTISDSTEAGRAILTAVDAPAQRTALGLVIGTNVQAQDAELAAISGLTSAADKVPYFTGSGTASLATFTTAGRNLLDDEDVTAQRATLGLGTAATTAATAYATATQGAKADTAVQPSSLGTAAVEDVEAFDAAGAAATAVSGHTTAINHTLIGTAVQGDGTVLSVVALTQAAYATLTPVSTTLYIITDA